MDKHALFQQFISFVAAVHQTTHEMTKESKSEAITPLQYSILEYIAVNQPVTISQISDCQHISMPNASRELKKLGEKQLCEKIDDDDDRRKQYIRLSPDGEAMMNESFGHTEARFLERIGGLTEEELAEVRHALQVLGSKVFF